MRAAQIDRYGPPQAFVVRSVARHGPLAPDQVRVEVHAASINPIDTKIRGGKQRGVIRYRLPRTLGLDLSGVVNEVGSAVTQFRPGDEVYGSPDHRGAGCYAEECVVRERELAHKPRGLDHLQAASLPLVGLTAWQCLHPALARGEPLEVLVLAGSGGVGTFAIQLARAFGARVSTTCSPRNAELVRSLGATRVVDYRSERFEDVLPPQDLLLDSVGGETTWRALRHVRRGGRLASIVSGLPANTERYGPHLGALVSGLRMARLRAAGLRRGVDARTVVRRPDGGALSAIAGLVDDGAIQPVIDRVFPLEQVADAHAYLETGRARGKVVLAVR